MPRSSTDGNLSIEAAEFRWEGTDLAKSHAVILPIVKEWLEETNATSVLDLGCGNGAVTNWIHQLGYQVIGTDISESGIKVARAAYPQLTFFRHDIAEPFGEPLSASSDIVVSLEVIEHLLLPRQLFYRAAEALKPGGTLILSTPFHGYLKNIALALTNSFDDHWHPLRDYGHVKFFSKDTVIQLAEEQGFECIEFEHVGRIKPFAKSMLLKLRKCNSSSPLS